MLTSSLICIDTLFFIILSNYYGEANVLTTTSDYRQSSQPFHDLEAQEEEEGETGYSDDTTYPDTYASYEIETTNVSTLTQSPTNHTLTTDQPTSTSGSVTTTVHQTTEDNLTTTIYPTTEYNPITTIYPITEDSPTTTVHPTTEENLTTTVHPTTEENLTTTLPSSTTDGSQTSIMTTTTTTVAPDISVHKLSIKSGSSYCFLFQSDIIFQIFYYTKEKQIKSYKFAVSNATVNNNESICTERYTKLSFKFMPNGQNVKYDWKCVLLFIRIPPNEASNDMSNISSAYSLNNIAFTYYLDTNIFPDSMISDKYIDLSGNTTMFKIPVGSYYSCISEQQISLAGNDSFHDSCKVYFKSLKVEAFMNSPKEAFVGNQILCDLDENVNNIVPIAVGITLIICIVIAVTVFIIFNRRNRRRYATL
ncbi:hypothetical protein MN116_002257 [Schistosoma mekongi]|uniref:CUB domain-containing protein n=1 Tax=Schistosoma mekongi TaxID=38744 RepID=A0AAE1ZJE6_SCHME|nr:hypothetical protein MN116_002257 [Schistosoma mekongi]